MCLSIGPHEEDIGSPGAGVTGSREHLLWMLETKLGSPARTVYPLLTTAPSLGCLSLIFSGAEN